MSIVLTDVSARYGANLVVNGVSLDIQDGELFVLLGGSGSGKSTILRMIAGLTPPAAGRIEIGGRDVTDVSPQARGTGFVFQNYSVFRHMTVADNVEFGLRIRGVSRADREQRSIELLDLVGMGGLGARFPDQLSGGQQQRVAVARALAYEPEVLLLDEPFSALDVKVRGELRRSFKDIQRELGVTTILVTHDQEEAFELADRIGVIERGFLVEVSTPEALYHEPRTEFAATFVGGGNVVVGRIRDGRIQLGQVSLPLPPHAPPHEDDAPVRLLFRPETVLISDEPPDDESSIHVLGPGRVSKEIFSGSQQHLRLEMMGFEGVRPLSPPPRYGRRRVTIEAVAVSERGAPMSRSRLGRRVWVSLRDYHVLEPGGLKVLIGCSETAAGQAAFAFGGLLARAAGGPTTLLAVAEDETRTASREWLEGLRRQWPGGPSLKLTSKVRRGAFQAEVLAEAQEGHYELVVLGREEEGLGSVAQQILEVLATPVLLVREPRPRVARTLVCTAVGEPGKSDVLFGGRVVRHTRTAVTVLHIAPAGVESWERARIEEHMTAARAVLDGLDVEADTKVAEQRTGEPVSAIVVEAEAGDYDMLVIGAPAWQHPGRLSWHDFASEIVNRTSRPVLIVPMPR